MGDEPASAPPSVRAVTGKGFSWISVERPTSVECDELIDQYGLLPADLELALDRRQATSLARREHYLLIVFQVPLPTAVGKRRGIVVSPVAIFVRPDVLITVHTGDVRPLARLFRQLEVGAEPRDRAFASGVGGALFVLLNRLVDVAVDARTHLDQAISALEDDMLREAASETVGALAQLRREIRALRRLVAPLPTLIRGCGAVDLGLTNDDDWERLARRADRLSEALDDDVASLRDAVQAVDVATSLRRAVHLRALTGVAATTLPVIAVVLILGTLPASPLASQPNGFAIGLAIVGVVFLGALLVLKRRGIV